MISVFCSGGKLVSTLMVALSLAAFVTSLEDHTKNDYNDQKWNLLRGLSLENHNLDDEDSPAADDRQPKIIGGDFVNLTENRYPYFASLEGRCGGALISPSIVVTAAHCNGTSYVTVGAQYLLEVIFFLGETIEVESEIIHPGYGEGFYENDIMLLKLAEPSDQPYILLNLEENIPTVDDRPWVIGFGDTVALSLVDELSPILKEVELGYIPPEECDLAYGYDLIKEHMMCTTTTDNKSPCQGDSGGPLLLKGNSTDEDILLGTVSWADGCADPRFPDVYARISFFASWIVKHVCELSPDDAPEYMGCNVTTTVP